MASKPTPTQPKPTILLIRVNVIPTSAPRPSNTNMTCPPNIGPGLMLELDERKKYGQETLHSSDLPP